MEKYYLVKKESLQRYAELTISKKEIANVEKPEDLYSTIIEWVKNLTSGDINLTLEDFESSGRLLSFKPTKGKNYLVEAYYRLNTRESIVKIFRKENSYTIIHK